ncbi:MAG: hypothetical protein EOQ39_03715 [Mesorhizobium sp.]|uniref:phage head-tail joining protein n=1 Tax=Mesorhizobium sp. TaxID=1871066 RepID=UPI000FE55910|nr:hypothetical protein [Mesorhizobium sp.]RWB09017.1 MAG: hypothetical protein EOQ37_05870 [Mesorhizobium sp.]RWB17438.1 MAG: hypothetical protein EOQ39_03715 [Mesorhizobium sp.]
MATLADLQARLEKLRTVRATGVRSLRHGETSSEFRPDSEIASAIADLERQIAKLDGRPRVRTIYIHGKD